VTGDALSEMVGEVAAQHVDDVTGWLLRDEQRDARAATHGHQLVGRRLAIGDDHDGRLQGHDALDAAFLVFGGGIREVRGFASADDLHPVGVDVVEVTHQIRRRLGELHGRFVKPALRVGVSGHPFPVQGRTVGFEQRLGADDGKVFEAHGHKVGGRPSRNLMMPQPRTRRCVRLPI